MKRALKVFSLLCLVWWVSHPAPLWGQSSLSLSVTPTLFDVSVNPGQTWQSSVRVVNPNEFPITVYAEPVLLSTNDERGVGSFTPLDEVETMGVTLAEWIDVTSDPIVVPEQETATVPFSVQVPENAAPGGRYAAILLSTQSPDESAQPVIRTSQAVSSLFFMSVEGEVVEQGSIRSFRPTEAVVERPENTFSLRFQNQGTVHLQPQGDITIYNMWGESRGVVPVNQRTDFGKVLPDSIREYTFRWKGEYSLLDIGRYRAEATLGYGSDERSFVQQTAYFWVIPVYGLLVTLGTIVTIVLLIGWLVRLYIKRTLELAGVVQERPIRRAAQTTSGSTHTSDINLATADKQMGWWQKYSLPWRAGYRDIRHRLTQVADGSYRRVAMQLLHDYRWFVVAIVILLFVSGVAVWYYHVVATPDRSYETQVVDANNQATDLRNSEEEYLAQLEQAEAGSIVALATSSVMASVPNNLTVINISGVPGAAASFVHELSGQLPEAVTLRADLERTERNSVVVYPPEELEYAQMLSQKLGGALLSVQPDTVKNGVVTVYVGADVVVK